jgi:hypothetical protein
MTRHDTENSNLLLGDSLSIASDILVTNLMKECATKGNHEKHKTFSSQPNETIRNNEKQNLFSDTKFAEDII